METIKIDAIKGNKGKYLQVYLKQGTRKIFPKYCSFEIVKDSIKSRVKGNKYQPHGPIRRTLIECLKDNKVRKSAD